MFYEIKDPLKQSVIFANSQHNSVLGSSHCYGTPRSPPRKSRKLSWRRKPQMGSRNVRNRCCSTTPCCVPEPTADR